MNNKTQRFTGKSTEYPDLEITFLDSSFRNTVILPSSTIGIGIGIGTYNPGWSTLGL